MLHDLIGRTALITGAARRIGRETSLALAEQGANMIVHYNQSAEQARQLAEQVERLGVRAWTVAADFRRPQDYGALVKRSQELAGEVDILINNASIFPPGSLRELTWADFSANMEVNAWVPLTLSRQFAQGLARGSIVNLHDTHLEGFDLAHAGYILSKHVLAALTRMMALEFAPNVAVNAVAPGLILPPPGQDSSYLQAHAQRLPLKRHGDPRDIAEAIVFLLRSNFITGQVIYVDGGRQLHG